MPTYTVNDPTSGKTIKITGDSPPSEEELNQIFAAAGNQSQPGMLQKVGSAAEGVSNFLFPATTQAVKGAIKDPNSLNKEFETPMSVPAKVLGGVASVMTPGSGAAVMRQNTPLGSAGREMLTNIVGGELLGAGVNKAGEIAAPLVEQVGSRLAESALGEFGQRLAQKAVSKVANISGKEFTDFEIATQGKNLIDTMYKYLQKVPGSDKLRALYGKAGKDGILDSEMKSAESVIQKRIAQEGPDAIAYIDELLQPIDDLLEKVATKNVDAQTGKVTYEALPGQDQIVEALKSFSDKTRSRFVDKGLTAKMF